MLSEYDVLAEARIVANNALPEYDAKAMRRLLEAAWDRALADNFLTRRSLDG